MVGAQVTYSCGTDLVLVGETVATCSLPSLQWIPSSDDIMCVQPSLQWIPCSDDIMCVQPPLGIHYNCSLTSTRYTYEGKH